MAKTFGRKQDPSAKTAAAEAAASSVDDKPRRGTTSRKTPEQRLAEVTIPPHFLVPPLLYSPTQLYIATFLGGPLAATYGLYKNAMALEEYEDGVSIICVGVFYSVATVVLLPYIGGLYGLLACVPSIFAHNFCAKQLEVLGDGARPRYKKKSWLIVLALSLAFLAISIIAFLLAIHFFPSLMRR